MSLTTGKYLAIIAKVTLGNGRGKAEGCTVCELNMIVTRGEHRGHAVRKRYFYHQELPDIMKKEFLMLGFTVQSPEDIPQVKNDLIGKIALLMLSTTDGKFNCYIEGYVGSDKPEKYYPINR